MLKTAAILLFAASAFALEWRTEGGQTVLYEGARPLLAYNQAQQLAPGAPEDRRRCCYVHPVRTLAGVVVTDDFPKDHYHHRGLFWAWPIVQFDGRTYDLWLVKDIRQVSVSVKTAGARLEAVNEWRTADKALVREHVVLTARPPKGKAYDFDVELRLEALGAPVLLAGAPDAGKSYGGALNVRFAPRTETVIRTESGVLPKDDDLHPHDWTEFEAVYQGKRAALRIAPDSKNPGFPHQWCLRQYGFVGASFPGKTAIAKDYTLRPGQPLALRYRVTVTDR